MSGSDTPPDEELVRAARQASGLAYAPYSGYRVGAALVGASGRVWTGGNIEIAASGVSLCAERVALAKAVSEGERAFRRLVLVGPEEDPIAPCGVCRQTLQEFGDGMSVLMVGADGRRQEATLSELIPFPYARRPKR
jgi:homotetrameric cytidine deaminase